MLKSKPKKNKIEHNEEILRESWNRTMIEIWSTIPTSLVVCVLMGFAKAAMGGRVSILGLILQHTHH